MLTRMWMEQQECKTLLVEMQNTDTMKGKRLNNPHLGNDAIQNSYLTSNPSLCLIPVFPSLWIKVKSSTLTLTVNNTVVFRVKSELTPPAITTSCLPISCDKMLIPEGKK